MEDAYVKSMTENRAPDPLQAFPSPSSLGVEKAEAETKLTPIELLFQKKG
jgi:hypothetical protein